MYYIYMYIRTHRRRARLIVGPITAISSSSSVPGLYILYYTPSYNRVDFIHDIADVRIYFLCTGNVILLDESRFYRKVYYNNIQYTRV